MKLAQLLDRVHDEYPGVPELMALRALSDAAKEFFSRTHAWQQTLDAVQVMQGQPLVELDFDPGTMLAAIKDVRVNGHKVYAWAPESPRLMRNTPGSVDVPVGFIQHDPNSIELVPAVQLPATLYITAALTLRMNATDVDIPDGLMDEYGPDIASGAKAKLVMMAAQPWYAPAVAAAYAGPFYLAVNKAKRRSWSSLDGADLRVAQREWV